MKIMKNKSLLVSSGFVQMNIYFRYVLMLQPYSTDLLSQSLILLNNFQFYPTKEEKRRTKFAMHKKASRFIVSSVLILINQMKNGFVQKMLITNANIHQFHVNDDLKRGKFVLFVYRRQVEKKNQMINHKLKIYEREKQEKIEAENQLTHFCRNLEIRSNTLFLLSFFYST